MSDRYGYSEEFEAILTHGMDKPGYLERLMKYDADVFSPRLYEICDGCEDDSDEACDECVRGCLSQLEYDMHTEIIKFAEQLYKDWAAGSGVEL